MSPNDNGWHEWKMHVLSELERLNKQCESRCTVGGERYLDLHKRIDEVEKSMLSRFAELNAEISALKVKSGFWGAVGALLVLMVPAVIKLLM